MTQPILRLKNLGKRFVTQERVVEAIRGISMDVAAGEFSRWLAHRAAASRQSSTSSPV